MDNHYRKGWKDFLDLCLATEDPAVLSEMLEMFLTIEEKESIAMRTLIVKDLIAKEKSQRDIAKDLNVSIAKITRGSNALKRLNKKLLSFLEKKLL